MNHAIKSLLRTLVVRPLAFALPTLALLAATPLLAQVPQLLSTVAPASLADAVEAGALPGSQRLSLILTLTPDATRTAALDQFLAASTAASSASYHKWLTPAQFAAAYAPSAGSLEAATAWAQANGLSVESISPAGNRLTISGPASRIQNALAISLRQYQIAGQLFFANSSAPLALPFASAIDGLDNLPASLGTQGQDSFATLAAQVDANAAPVLILDSALTAATLTPSHAAEYQALSRQAAAQGISLLAPATFPAIRPEILAIAAPGALALPALDPTLAAQRPTWQNALGLPSDNLREAPDFTAASLAALAQTISTLVTQTGSRQGSLGPILYALAPTPKLFTQPDAAASGTWESATGLGLIDLAVLAKAFPRATGGAQVQVQPSSYSPTHGQPYSLNASVTSTNNGPTPGGTVTFTSSNANFTSMSINLDGNGNATYPPTQSPGGSYSITATYSGDPNYGSATGTSSINIQPEAANFAIAAPATATLGSTVTVSVSLSAPSGYGVPTGSVTVTPNGLNNVSSQTATLTTQGTNAQATYTFTPKQAATITFQAACTSGDQSFTCYNQPNTSTSIPQAGSTTTLTLSNNSPTAGTAITLTATVAGVQGISPTGTVQFYDGSTNLGSGTAPTATLTTTLQAGTTHALKAVYQGDGNYTTSTSATATPSVGTDPTTTTGMLAAATVTYGTNDMLTVNVAPTTGATINGSAPTGNVTITGIGNPVVLPLGGGSVVVPLNSVPVGTYSLAVAYPGDTNYSASSVSGITFTVTQSVATVTDMISSNNFTTGSTATLTVQITLPGNNPVLPPNSGFTATIVGAAGATYPGVFMVNAGGNTGTGSVTINAPIAGTYSLQVTCATNTLYTCMGPTPITIVSTATTATPPPGTGTGTTATSTVLTLNPTAPVAGTPVTLTATVSAAAAATTANPITGTVTFYDGTTLLGSANAIKTSGANGVATASITLTGTAMHSLTAVYSGDTVYMTSTSAAVTVTTAATPAGITLTSSVTTGLAGLSVTLTARVTGSTATGTSPTGTVSFYLASSTSLLGTVTLATGGASLSAATLTTTGLPAGVQTIYAIYSGDTNFSSITSNNVTIGLADYGITFTPTALTITQGHSGQVALLINNIANFGGTVAFGCIPPANTQITCSFAPTLVTGGGTTMTITTAAVQTSSLHQQGSVLGERIAGVSALAALFSFLLPGRKRRRIPALLLVLLTLALTANLGCSSGNNFTTGPQVTNSGTPLGTFIVTVDTAGSDTMNTIRHNFSYQVTVQ